MSWHYRIRRRKVTAEMWWYDIIAFYQRHGASVDAQTPGARSRKHLILELERMLKDAKKYRTLTQKPLDTAQRRKSK